jgi:hypothetical protein
VALGRPQGDLPAHAAPASLRRKRDQSNRRKDEKGRQCKPQDGRAPVRAGNQRDSLFD